jgi:molybdopterin-binding protein
MKLSTRNQIAGTIKTVKPGMAAIAVIKASDVMVGV